MKKIYLLVFLSLLSASLFSQRNDESKFKGGIRVGLTASQISGDDLAGFNKLGAHAGGFVHFPISQNRKWKFQMELDFTMKGSTTPPRRGENINMFYYTLNLFYAEVPFLVKYNIIKGFEIEAGPTVGLLFANTEKGLDGNIRRPPFRLFELSALIGVNYLFRDHWGVSIRYSNSIIPVRIPTWVYNRVVSKQYNSLLSFSLYYQF